MLWGRREMFEVTQHAALAWQRHLLDWAGVHTGRSEAAETKAAAAAAGAAAGVAVAVVVAGSAARAAAPGRWESAAGVAPAGSGSIAAWRRAAGSSCCSWRRRARWRRRGRRRRGRAISEAAQLSNATSSQQMSVKRARASACRRDGVSSRTRTGARPDWPVKQARRRFCVQLHGETHEPAAGGGRATLRVRPTAVQGGEMRALAGGGGGGGGRRVQWCCCGISDTETHGAASAGVCVRASVGECRRASARRGRGVQTAERGWRTGRQASRQASRIMAE